MLTRCDPRWWKVPPFRTTQTLVKSIKMSPNNKNCQTSPHSKCLAWFRRPDSLTAISRIPVFQIRSKKAVWVTFTSTSCWRNSSIIEFNQMFPALRSLPPSFRRKLHNFLVKVIKVQQVLANSSEGPTRLKENSRWSWKVLKMRNAFRKSTRQRFRKKKMHEKYYRISRMKLWERPPQMTRKTR